MYFKVEKGSDTFNKLTHLGDEIERVRKAAQTLCKKLGGSDYGRFSSNSLAGGIDGIMMKEKPEGWRNVGSKYDKAYYPKSIPKNKAVLAELAALPVIEHEELNDIVGFKGMQMVSSGGGFGIVHTVAVSFGKEVILIKSHEGTKITPPKDMIEIVQSEFEAIKKKLDKPKKKKEAV